jgi:hypothetical protein
LWSLEIRDSEKTSANFIISTMSLIKLRLNISHHPDERDDPTGKAGATTQ